MLYKSLVGQFWNNYAAPVWCPYLAKDIHALESVQRRASRLALNQRKGDMPYEDRCQLLKNQNQPPLISISDRFNTIIKSLKFSFQTQQSLNFISV